MEFVALALFIGLFIFLVFKDVFKGLPTKMPGSRYKYPAYMKRQRFETKLKGKTVDAEFINVKTYPCSEERKVKRYVDKLKHNGISDVRVVPYEDTLEIYIPFLQGQPSPIERNKR